MKYFLIFAIALLVVWLWKNNRRAQAGDKEDRDRHTAASRPATPMVPTEIVACDVCHVHLPRFEALTGPGGGVYCSAAHRKQAGLSQTRR